jgi:hypothetical protein
MPPLLHGRILPEPEAAVRAELRRGVWHVHIKWRGLPDEDATWEQLEEFRSHYSGFQLEDELFAQAGRDVMVGKTFGGALDVARGRARLGQGPRAQSFNFQEILGGSLAIRALINTHVNSWF